MSSAWLDSAQLGSARMHGIAEPSELRLLVQGTRVSLHNIGRHTCAPNPLLPWETRNVLERARGSLASCTASAEGNQKRCRKHVRTAACGLASRIVGVKELLGERRLESMALHLGSSLKRHSLRQRRRQDRLRRSLGELRQANPVVA